MLLHLLQWKVPYQWHIVHLSYTLSETWLEAPDCRKHIVWYLIWTLNFGIFSQASYQCAHWNDVNYLVIWDTHILADCNCHCIQGMNRCLIVSTWKVPYHWCIAPRSYTARIRDHDLKPQIVETYGMVPH